MQMAVKVRPGGMTLYPAAERLICRRMDEEANGEARPQSPAALLQPIGVVLGMTENKWKLLYHHGVYIYIYIGRMENEV